MYAAADGLLYPSLANQDTVVAEGLAAGLPIIGVAGTGAAIMAGDAGLMAPRRPHTATVQGLASAIRALSQEKVHSPVDLDRRKKTARLRSRELSWPATARGIVAAYTP